MISNVYISIGSNMGDRAFNIDSAISQIQNIKDTRVISVSSYYETAPVGYLEQDDFINAAARLSTGLSPHELLGMLQSIETNLGRKRTLRWGPRIIDIDILLWEDLCMKQPDLEIPHPRMNARAFVLIPLHDVLPHDSAEYHEAEAQMLFCEDTGGVRMFRKQLLQEPAADG
jgi:2-amino-4-hydroxy-6-hydroxymethyldihydropteridine diphosphokinase